MSEQFVPEIRVAGFDEPWHGKRLQDLVDVVGGGTPSTAVPAFWGGEIDWYSPSEIGTSSTAAPSRQKITKLGLESSSAKILPGGRTVLFTSRASIGHAAVLDHDAATNQGFQSLVVKQGTDVQFMYAMTSDIAEYACSQATGSTFLEVSSKALRQMEVVVPSAREQSAVGTALQRFTRAIEEHEQKHHQLKQAKASLMQRMFPSPGASEPEIRFEGFTGAWQERRLGDVATFINGRAYSQPELLGHGKYPVLRVGNFYTNSAWYYSDLELSEKFYANKGDLLYTWSATFGPHIWTGGKVVFHYHIWRIDLSDAFDKLFALQLLERDRDSILAGHNGTTMAHITKEGMEDKRVLLAPSMAEQQAIGAFFSKLDDLIEAEAQYVSKLQQVKSALLQKMFV